MARAQLHFGPGGPDLRCNDTGDSRLLSAATLLFYASALWKWAQRAGWWRRAGVGLMFAAMSLDEAARLHERPARLYRIPFGEAPLEHYTC